MCKCKVFGTILLLVLALIFLLKDLNVWNFWNISGWTVLFFLLGLKFMHKCCCKECQYDAKKGKK